MSKIHGRFTRLYIDGYDVSGDANSFEPSYAADTAEVSGFGDDTKSYAVGLVDPSVRVAGVFNDGANRMHPVATPRIATDIMLNGVWGTSRGQPGVGGSVAMSEYSVQDPISGAVAYTAQFAGAGSSGGTFEFVTTIHPKSNMPAGTTGYDSGTVSNQGFTGHLQLFSGTGTVRIESSTAAATAATWTPRIDFGLRTAPYAAYVGTYAGTAPQFLRAIMTNGTGTAWVGFKRL